MKNVKSIFIVLFAVLFGLALGYFLFGKNGQSSVSMQEHQQEGKAAPATEKLEEWICSMHPQIRQNEPGLCPICEMDLIPANSASSDDPTILEMTENAIQLANVQTTVIGSMGGVSEKTIALTGRVQEDERLASSQVAHLPGRIEKLYVTFTGEQVKKGQKLATIYSPELITAQRELLEAKKLLEINPNLLEAARNKLRYWKIDESMIQSIEEKSEVQETFNLYASDAGVVMDRRVSVGDYVKKGESLFGLIDLQKVWVLFDAYEEQLMHFSVGDQITFTTPAFSNKTYKARVTFIDPVINPTTRVASLRTEVNNPAGRLKPAMFVNGVLNKRSNENGQLSVPKSAVLWTGQRSVVYVKLPDMEVPSFQYREIEIGSAVGNNYLVVSGLEAGEEVVTNGSFTIDAAAQLNNQQSMMNKEVKVKKEKSDAIPNFIAETPIAFQEQLNEVANAYILLKDAFVATDAVAAGTTVKEVIAKIEKVNKGLLEGEAHLYWMEQLDALQSHSQIITETEDVERQRKQFGFLSDALINAITAFGTSGEALYLQHCPMAFDNEGGDWLATEETIQNPYFGDKMMKCGLVKRMLSAKE